MDWSRTIATALGILLCATGVVAQESPQIEPLNTIVAPVAVAVRPGGNAERHELFVADETGRVVRLASDALDQPQDVIAASGKSPAAIAFLNSRTCIVVSADVPPALRAYEIPDEAKTIPADDTKFEVQSAAEANCRASGIVLGPTALFVVGRDGNEAGWVLRSRVRSSVPGDLKLFVNTREKGGGSQPTCIAISTRGWVLVGDAGERDPIADSRLAFYHPTDATAEPALTIEPGLLDIVAIAYSPQGSLFAADFAETEPERGGIYRIDMSYDANTIGGKAVRVALVEHPTAVAFANDGTLYVIGRDGENSGQLLRLKGVE